MKRLLYFLWILLLPFPSQAQHEHHHGEDRAIEFPDVPEYQVLKADLHQHTVFSDGHVWPSIRVQEALKDELDAIAMTDHLEYQPHSEDIPHPNRNRAYQVARQAADEHELLVINGSEITREMPPGHANAIFLEDANPLLKDDPMAVFEEAHSQGAFTFWNHPMWIQQKPSGIASLTDMHRDLIAKGWIQGIEVANKHRYSAEALQIALDHDLTMLGTSDIHGLIDWDYKVHHGGHRPITLAFVNERSKKGLKEALFEGRTAVWFDNTLVGKEKYVVPLVTSSLTVTEAHYRGDSSVLEVTIKNRSDAQYVLDSQNEVSFHGHSDVVHLKPQDTRRLQVKPGERVNSIQLTFEVLNVVTAPEEHPSIPIDVTVSE